MFENTMAKNALNGLLMIGLAFTISCSKKVKEDAADQGGGSGVISSDPMSFGPGASSDNGAIEGLNTVNFEYDSATLDATARQKLSANAAWMKARAGVSMQIEGHCDSRGSVEYNLALGERRAKVVKDYLTSLGVEGNRLSIISYGKEKPLELGDTEAVHARNRRANFVPSSN